eukprot:gene12985-60667_t
MGPGRQEEEVRRALRRFMSSELPAAAASALPASAPLALAAARCGELDGDAVAAALRHDATLAAASGACAVCCLAAGLRSAPLAAHVAAQLAAAFPVALAAYVLLLRRARVGPLHALSPYVLAGVGVGPLHA